MWLRGVVAWFAWDQFGADPDAYRAIADSLSQRGVFGLIAPSGEVVPTAFRPPLYPFVLSWCWGDHETSNRLWAATLHSVLGGITAGCIYGATKSWVGGIRGTIAGIVAALLVIVDPILVQQSTLVMTETMAAAIVSVILWWWVTRISRQLTLVSVLVLGFGLAAAYLCRPTFVVWGAMLIVCLALSNQPMGAQRLQRLVAACGVASIVLASVLGWSYRNLRVLGHPTWATTHGGYTLLLGNNPLLYRHLRDHGPLEPWDASRFLNAYAHRYEGDPTTDDFWFQPWDQPVRPQPELSASLTEHADDQLTYRAAKATIDRDGGMFVRSSLYRVAMLWTPIPQATQQRSIAKRITIGLYYCLLYLAALIGVVRMGRRWRESTSWPIPALLLTLTLVHAVYWSNMRMRAPAMPAIAMLAAAALTTRPSRREQSMRANEDSDQLDQ
jgi:hypothetical protein